LIDVKVLRVVLSLAYSELRPFHLTDIIVLGDDQTGLSFIRGAISLKQ